MKRKTRRVVYVLEALVNYEGSTILGIYSTKRKAEKAQAKHVAGPGFQPDEYQIGRVVVNS